MDGGGGELRLSQLVARLEERFGHEVSFLSTSGGMLLCPGAPRGSRDEDEDEEPRSSAERARRPRLCSRTAR